jgi:chemotaxis protein methyltransferase CheR
VCRRIQRRLRELGLVDLGAYRARLEADPAEWALLDAACLVPISRLFRDRDVFEALQARVLPALAARAGSERRDTLRAWSAGCASGEEAWSLAIVARRALGSHLPGPRLRIVATDADPHLLERARRACFSPSSVKEVPADQLAASFDWRDGMYCVRVELRNDVDFRRQDLRREVPGGPFDLVLCRNVAFTYFAAELRREVLARICGALRPGGALVIGLHESLPDAGESLAPWPEARAIYERR